MKFVHKKWNQIDHCTNNNINKMYENNDKNNSWFYFNTIQNHLQYLRFVHTVIEWKAGETNYSLFQIRALFYKTYHQM